MGYDQTIGKQFFGIVEELLRIGESYDYSNDANDGYDYEPNMTVGTELLEQNYNPKKKPDFTNHTGGDYPN